MSEQIKVGDLVMFRHVCCDAFTDGVTVFTVASIRPTRAGYSCAACNSRLPDEPHAADAPQYPGAPISWLKRIPPLGELEDVNEKEDLREPA